MVQTANPDLTIIPDKAEVWLLMASTVTDIQTKMPSTPGQDLDALGWSFTGLVGEKIPLTPSGEVKEYDAFGRPAYRTKFRKGKLQSGFTALEYNDVMRQLILPGSAGNKIGIPKNVQIYVLYKWVDEDVAGGTRIWVSLRPALAELKSLAGINDGEEWSAEIVVHHTADAYGDVFQTFGGLPVTKVFTLGSGLTAYMVTVDGKTTEVISTLTSAALQTALRALSNIGSSGVTVTGSSGGPFTAVFSVPVINVVAAGTGGTIGVS